MEPSNGESGSRIRRSRRGIVSSGRECDRMQEENPFLDPSRRTPFQNITSISHDFLSPSSRQASYSMLVPPPLIEGQFLLLSYSFLLISSSFIFRPFLKSIFHQKEMKGTRTEFIDLFLAN